MKKRSFKRKSARTPIHRPGRNGKLGQRMRIRARRIADGEFYPKPNGLKRDWRRAVVERCQLERDALANAASLYPGRRPEEALCLQLFKGLPSIFAIMERIRPGYHRPDWASQRWGAA